jgi:hypothetical protein
MLTSKEFKNVATQFRNTSSDAKKVETSLRNAIEQQTAKEKGALDIALTNYKAAVKREMDTKENKERVKKLKSYSDHMEKTLDKCFSAFEKTVKAIQESNDSDKMKLQKINQTADFVMGQLFSEDERQMFGDLLSQVVVVVPSQHSQQSLLHAPQHSGWTTLPDNNSDVVQPSDVRMLTAPGSYHY